MLLSRHYPTVFLIHLLWHNLWGRWLQLWDSFQRLNHLTATSLHLKIWFYFTKWRNSQKLWINGSMQTTWLTVASISNSVNCYLLFFRPSSLFLFLSSYPSPFQHIFNCVWSLRHNWKTISSVIWMEKFLYACIFFRFKDSELFISIILMNLRSWAKYLILMKK